MMEHIVRIISVKPEPHNIRQFRFEKPEGYTFIPGQATEISINKPDWEDEKRPFTFTSLNDDPYLELTTKIYSDHNGVTNELGKLKEGDELIIRDVWGAIEYKGAGYFIAGGAGITPFIAILRQLHKDNALAGNKLFFSNRTAQDVILEHELTAMLGDDAMYILTNDSGDGYVSGRIDEAFLRSHIDDINKHFYICGPDPMISDINAILERMGAKPDAVVFEK